ncbi:MAG: hypothetical protein QXK74_05390 [Candidatus Nitrosocaldaceae archaeon]
MEKKVIKIDINGRFIEGDLTISSYKEKIVIFAHGSGSSRFSPRNRFVADVLNNSGLSTLLLDLLTKEEEVLDLKTAEYRFNIELLSERLIYAAKLLKGTNIGYFGASTGAAAALIAAAKYPDNIKAIVSRGGRVDLSIPYLHSIHIPTLLIVGSKDEIVLELNKDALYSFPKDSIVKLEVIENASHLFEEPNKLEQVAEKAKKWFLQYL